MAFAAFAQWGAPLDWIAISMAAAAAVAFLPQAKRGRAAAAVIDPGTAALVEGARPADSEDRPKPIAEQPPAAEPKPATFGPPLVECLEVARNFGGVRALRGITLTIHEGELVGLVGPNGSGKTTLVNLITGALPPSAGDIRLAGRSIRGLAPHKIAHLGVARTYQIPRPFESMSVRDNVAVAIMFGRESTSLARARTEATAYLDLVGMLPLAAARPSQINLHERQLLEMARALAAKPRVLLLDEALAGLNPAEIVNAVEVVRRIHRSGVTIVLVEHVLRVVNQLATRIVVLDQGMALAEGAPAVVMREQSVIRAYLGRHADA
jgi:branched-chain amino acid transport system permease protein